MNATIDDGYNLFNVGYLPFKYIYNELGINDFFINKQRNLNICLLYTSSKGELIGYATVANILSLLIGFAI